MLGTGGGREAAWREGQNTKVTVDYVRASVLQSVKSCVYVSHETGYRVLTMAEQL